MSTTSGPPDQLEELQTTNSSSRLEDDTTKIIQQPNGRASDFAKVIGSLVPPGTQVSAIESSNSILVKAGPRISSPSAP